LDKPFVKKGGKIMEPIRTPKGKMYGTLDKSTYVLHIKDGPNVRLIKIPPEGIELQYISGKGQAETIYIPPKDSLAV